MYIVCMYVCMYVSILYVYMYVLMYLPYVITVCIYTGDAETAPLSALSCALGEQQCSFYGITQVEQSEAVFQNIGAVSNSITVTCAISAGME